jgi:G3E family GTPase
VAGVTPVTLLAGFVGSGKMSLLENALADPRYADTAVVLDPQAQAPRNAVVVSRASAASVFSGRTCACCRMTTDLVRALRELHVARSECRVASFSRVVVELAGLALPTPVLAALNELPVVASRFTPAMVVTVVDVRSAVDVLAVHREVRVQVAVADRIVMAGSEAVSAAGRAAVEARLARLNPWARRLSADADPDGWLGGDAPWDAALGSPEAQDADIRTTTWRYQEPVPWTRVETALKSLVEQFGPRLLRAKGLVAVEGEAGPRAVHAAGHTLYPSARLPAWPPGRRDSVLVLVTEGLDSADFARILTLLPSPSR